MTSQPVAALWWVIQLAIAVATIQVKGADIPPLLTIGLGEFLLHPQLSLSQSFSDNLFSTRDRIGDEITTLGLGMSLQVGRVSKDFVIANYGFSQRFYAENPSLNGTDHSLGLGLALRGSKLSFSGTESFQFLSQPLGSIQESRPVQPAPGESGQIPDPSNGPGPPGGGNETIIQVPAGSIDRTTHAESYLLSYAWSEKTHVYLQATRSATDYQASISLFDETTVRAVFGYSYQLLPKTSVFGEAVFGRTTLEANSTVGDQPASTFFGGAVGVRGRFSEKLSGELRLGYEARKFGGFLASPDYPVLNASVSYAATPKRNLTLSIASQQEISSQFSQSSYKLLSVGARLNQNIGSSGKWSGSAGASVSRYDYVGTAAATSDYHRFVGDVALRYQIQRWLVANLSYNLSAMRRAAVGADDYSANQVSLSFAVGY